MPKEINEKTFELNITSELLNLSKSFIWYLNHFPWFAFPTASRKNIVSRFLNQSILFAEGLTQEQENNKATGGYDVSINYSHPNGQEGRLMFLQYKAGIRKKYSSITASKFHRKTALKGGISPAHISFTFNDAADGTQHSTLRNLANNIAIQPQSVLYVFPRITEKTELIKKVGNLAFNASFVPVLQIDNQASTQIPPIIINDGVTHKYRTSYDGVTSEINFFFFQFFYDNDIILDLLSELICIQIERFVTMLIKEDRRLVEIILDDISSSFDSFIEYQQADYSSNGILEQNVKKYIDAVKQNFSSSEKIQKAPSKYTTIIPQEGLNLIYEGENNFSSIKYQIF